MEVEILSLLEWRLRDTEDDFFCAQMQTGSPIEQLRWHIATIYLLNAVYYVPLVIFHYATRRLPRQGRQNVLSAV